MITITGLGDHDRPDWLITMTGIRRVAFRKKVYDTPDALQADLDEWMAVYNEQRTHQGRWCFGKTPLQTFLDSAAWAREKQNGAMAA